jgi:hypothetical protein
VKVKQSYEEFTKRRAQVIAIAMTAPPLMTVWLKENPLPFPIFSDPELKAYRAFGLQKTSLLKLLNPLVIGRYVKQIFEGGKIRRILPGEDPLQLGGDFLVTQAKTLIASWTSSDPTRQPELFTILSLLDQLTKPE